MRDAQGVLLAWLRFLEEKRVDHCLLRTLDGTTGEQSGSVDIAVARHVLVDLPKLIYSFCLREDLLYVQQLHCEEQTWRHVLSWSNSPSDPPQFLRIDMTGDYYFAGRLLLSSERIQAMRVESVSADPTQRIPIVGPNIEFVHRLLRCVTAQRCSGEEAQRLRALWQRDSAGTANLLLRLWPSEGSALIAVAAFERWEELVESLPRLRKRLQPSGLRGVTADWRRWRRQLERWRRPTGLLVACLGPDGSGKRTLIAGLQERPLEPFERISTMRLRPALIRQTPTNPTFKPWLAKPRSSVVVPLKLAIFVIDYWLGYLIRMRPKLTHSALVVSDRYYDDVLVDPRRYRLRRRYALARALVPWIPRPDLWLVLDAPAEALSERQREVTQEESERLRAEYRRVLRGKDNRVVLDASRSPADVLAAAQRAIVKNLAQRTGVRLELPQEAVRNPLSARILLFFCRHPVPLLGRLARAVFNSEIECRIPPDIHLPYPYGLLVHSSAVLGRHVTLMEQVTIDAVAGNPNVAPVIGDGVYVGEGARICGDVRIGDRAVIGANAVITKDVAPGATVVGTNRVIARDGVSAAVATGRGVGARVVRADSRRGNAR